MRIIKSVIYADFEEPRSRDHNLETPKLRKNYQFCLKKFINSHTTIKWLNVER